jgi:hypothetical protein
LSPVHSSSSFQRFFPLSKFEKTFEAIFLNDKDCKETLRRYDFKRSRREVSTSEKVGLISISDSKKEK